MNPLDYCLRVKHGRDRIVDRAVMARIALNALFDPHLYPVDLSELDELSSEANVVSRSMLSYCAMHPEYFSNLSARQVGLLKQVILECACAAHKVEPEGSEMEGEPS